LNKENVEVISGIAKIPIPRSKEPIVEPSNASDLPEFVSIVDEALYLFRANIFFKNFEIKGPADRTLLYALLFLQECLGKVAQAPNKSRKECEKSLIVSASGTNFPIPGESNFNLSAVFPSPANASEAEALRKYLGALRVELVQGLLDRLYCGAEEGPNKWWISLSKRKFMNKSL
jgi:actin related protein 2/3 complex, subunit 3